MILATVEIFKMDAYRNVLRYFFLSTPMLLTKFRVNWPFSSEEKGKKKDFQDGPHLGFPIGTILAVFISTSHLDASYQFSKQLALWFRKISEKKSFKMAAIRSKQFKLF